MRPVLIAILTACFFSLQSQTIETKPVSTDSKREFKNQGEQESYWAEQFFEKNHTKQNFDRYRGDIVVKGDSFQYADQTLKVVNTPKELRAIFSTGLFYPSLITGNNRTKQKSKEELDKLTAEQKVFYEITRTDSFSISDLEELPLLSKSPTQKRFRFWLYRPGLHNPLVCFIELTNQGATGKTEMGTFIKGAELTFYKEGWVVI